MYKSKVQFIICFQRYPFSNSNRKFSKSHSCIRWISISFNFFKSIKFSLNFKWISRKFSLMLKRAENLKSYNPFNSKLVLGRDWLCSNIFSSILKSFFFLEFFSDSVACRKSFTNLKNCSGVQIDIFHKIPYFSSMDSKIRRFDRSFIHSLKLSHRIG